jgi:hypothetical protein
MTSDLPATTCDFLHALGFEFAKTDRRTGHEHWLSQECLPHIHIILAPEQSPDIRDIVRAIYSAGASDQRDRSRSAFNTALDTIRNGQPIADITDLLALSETRNQEQGTKNAAP